MNERMLKELELLTVANLYGLREVASAPAGAPVAVTVPAPAPVPVPAPVRIEPVVARSAPSQPLEKVEALDWKTLRETVLTCTKCELCKNRKQAVFGVGSETGPWLFVGEGPGADEDEQGEPFVGQAGKLLDNMLTAAGLKRGRDVYIANVVKCRPPGNRTPTAEEAAACAPYLDRQIELIAPKLIVALGKTAAIRLLGEGVGEASLGSLRGRKHEYKGIPLVITYHPAYLLRTLPDKAKAWEDLLFARRTLAAS